MERCKQWTGGHLYSTHTLIHAHAHAQLTFFRLEMRDRRVQKYWLQLQKAQALRAVFVIANTVHLFDRLALSITSR